MLEGVVYLVLCHIRFVTVPYSLEPHLEGQPYFSIDFTSWHILKLFIALDVIRLERASEWVVG